MTRDSGWNGWGPRDGGRDDSSGAGCGARAAGRASGQTASPAAPTASTPPTATAEVRSECTAVAAAARNFADQIAKLVGGQVSRDQVKTAAQQLTSALDSAASVIKPESQADVEAARAALGKVETALAAQPIDLPAVRAAASEALAAINRVLAVCAPGNTLPPVPTS